MPPLLLRCAIDCATRRTWQRIWLSAAETRLRRLALACFETSQYNASSAEDSMRSRSWEPVLRQILGVLGAGVAPLGVSAGCDDAPQLAQTGGGGGAPANTGGSTGG